MGFLRSPSVLTECENNVSCEGLLLDTCNTLLEFGDRFLHNPNFLHRCTTPFCSLKDMRFELSFLLLTERGSSV